jgi:hypothetical protein
MSNAKQADARDVELQALRVEVAQWRRIAEAQDAELQRLRPDRTRRANADRQRAWRRRHRQFVVPVIE